MSNSGQDTSEIACAIMADMQHRALGSSGFEISSIGLGTWAIGGWGWGGQDDGASIAAIHAAVDHGINWIDTAPIYGSGHSETVVGRALAALPPANRPLVFTKFGLGDNSAAAAKSATHGEVIAECERSLRRLGVERIDLYQLHWPVDQPMTETAGACAQLLADGKIRAVGVSNFSVGQLEEWRATGVPLHSLQSPYSILRPAVAASQLPWCATNGVAALAYSPLFRGLLFGTWRPGKTFAPDDARSTHKDYVGARFARHLQAVDALRGLAAEGGLSCAQLCVGVLLRNPGLTACIAGARDARQGALVANLAVSVTDEQATAVWAIVDDLQRDLTAL
jgi:aryl-alcohol dehydrogenase-like predicted oxidoreductase